MLKYLCGARRSHGEAGLRSLPDFGILDIYTVYHGKRATKPQTWELTHLWVVPSMMRQGIGRALLAHAMLSAREGGASTIAIDADPNAEPFYLACRARREGVVAAPIIGNPARVRPQLSLPVDGSPSPANRVAPGSAIVRGN